MKQVNNNILPSLGFDSGGQTICECTARRWLAKLRYELKEAKKGIYVDGHEREDVVAYCKEFLMNFGANDRCVLIWALWQLLMGVRLRHTYTDDTLEPVEPQLEPGERLHVPVPHDETIYCSNELHCRVYVCG